MSKPASQRTLGDYTNTETESPDEPVVAADDDGDESPAEQALQKYDGAQYGQPTSKNHNRQSQPPTTDLETTCRYCGSTWTTDYARITVPEHGPHAGEMHGCRDCRGDRQMALHGALPGPHMSDAHLPENGGEGDD